ncbi:MAG: carbohydrate kinase family protein [Patescibacteria group bacterium]
MRDFSKKYLYEVISIGEATVDAFMTLDNPREALQGDNKDHTICLRQGAKTEVDHYDLCVGGNATNVAVGLKRMGINVGLCTEIGDDELSLKIRNTLAKEEIERLLVKQTNGPTNFSVILNFQGDRNLFVKNVERTHEFDFSDVVAPLVFLTSLGNEWKKAYKNVLEFVGGNKSTLAFNPGTRQLREGHDVVMEVLKEADLLFVNKEEAELLAKEEKIEETSSEYMEKLARHLQHIGQVKLVVITDGKKGSYALDEHGEFYFRETGKGKIVERTGAGDAYTSGFLAACLSGLAIEKAMEWGTQNATSVVGAVGAQKGLLTKKQMHEEVR